MTEPSGHASLARAATAYTAVDLGSLAGDFGFSLASDISPAGAVVGWSLFPQAGSGVKRAFLWKDGVMTELGTLVGRESIAWDINPAGQVVGSSLPAEGVSEPDVFLRDKGVMSDLGFSPSNADQPVGINPAGLVVSDGKVWGNGALIDLGTLVGSCTS